MPSLPASPSPGFFKSESSYSAADRRNPQVFAGTKLTRGGIRFSLTMDHVLLALKLEEKQERQNPRKC
ncbi:uncharacterized protein N7506_010758 [Penicillium brevicompactum]|uniref:uncharacterized protein n=1 Tax=Penicillium brevicompactum TaxID=5074 RepID=UPI00253F9BD2|nr:uncharacterized protein N7506_010758 [Penicillium brevicompactum]KAJ5321628.1 hypothetical protein N7506_010758 [Penicillium brevicompactum]